MSYFIYQYGNRHYYLGALQEGQYIHLISHENSPGFEIIQSKDRKCIGPAYYRSVIIRENVDLNEAKNEVESLNHIIEIMDL